MKKKNTAAEAEAVLTPLQKALDIVGDILFYVLMIAILVSAVLFASSKTPDKSILGYRYYDVLTGSMAPTYKVGDLIFVKLTDAANINTGDPITFNPGGTDDSYLTHRVVEKIEDYMGSGVTCFRTRGDANDSDDPFIIDESRVIGVVKMRIPVLGFVILFVQTHYVPVIIFIILFAVFFNLIKKYAAISAELRELEENEADENEAETPKSSEAEKNKTETGKDAEAETSGES